MLEILICTIDDGIVNAANIPLAPHEGVRYLVSWQHDRNTSHSIPAPLKRPDVTVVHMNGRGLSRNRNHALRHATGDTLLIADDDCSYTAEQFDGIVHHFAEQPDADILIFQAKDQESIPMRNYPPYPFDYDKRPRGTYVCSWELGMRRNPRLPRFDERFGLGSEYLACGEEEVFVHDAMRAGLTVRYIPFWAATTTCRETTGTRLLTDRAVARAKGATLCRVYGTFLAALHAAKESICLPYKAKRLRIFTDMLRGIKYFNRTTL